MKDAPTLIWIEVQEAVKLLWDDNPKLHDMGGVIESVVLHGFQELPKYDVNLKNISGGDGAIKAGNGRIEGVARMELDGDYELPRGLATVKDSGKWVMPLIIGTDAESLDLARAYAIDSNNLTLTGSDFTAYDLARLWSPESYLDMLKGMAEQDVLPVSVEKEDLQFFLEGIKLDLPDYSEVDDEDLGEIKTFRILVGNPYHLEDVLNKVRQLITENDEWEATIRL